MKKSDVIKLKNEVVKKPSSMRYIIAAVCFLLIIAAMVFIVFTQKQNPNPASEKIIREAVALQLSKDPNKLSDEDFKEIIELSLYRKELYDIKFLRKFTNLRRLDLVSIKSPDTHIPILKKILIKIGIIKLPRVHYLDLKPIENLSKLEELTLSTTLIKNIEPVKNLTNLNELACNGIDGFDFDLIKGLTNLKSLSVAQTWIHNFESIKNLKQLEHLWLWAVPVSDISPLKELTNIKIIVLQDMPISDIESVKHLKKLERITIEYCDNISKEQIEDLKNTFPNAEISYLHRSEMSGP